MKHIFIIGGSGGIGKALARELNSQGNKVYATYNTSDVSSLPEGIEFHKVDVTADELEFEFLPESLDGLIYLPGSIIIKPFNRISAGQFTHDYNLQVLGAVKSIQALLPRLKKSENASIVLFSTVAVQKGFPFHSMVSASKGAIEGLTRALAAELAPAIRVNCIAPSLTDTPLAANLLSNDQRREANAQRHPLKRIGKPADISSMAAFLSSDASSWMTGQVIHIDGGVSTING